MQSLSLKLTTVVSSGGAIYFLLLFYHAEICILRLKGWKLGEGLSVKSLHGANLYNSFVRYARPFVLVFWGSICVVFSD